MWHNNARWLVIVVLGWSIEIGAGGTYAASPAPPADPAQRGELVYRQVCLSCHGVDGKGGGYKNLTPPPADLTSADVQHKLDVTLYRTVHEGRKDTAMGAWKFTLTEAEIRDVLAYVRLLGQRGAGARP
ncbi:MAG: cytochrome c [Nitrospiraceae bacterium]|nr:cytochrome c [Nitrospiraceae bacterium]